MIRIIQSKSADQAKQYFRDALTKSDYYMEGQESRGLFYGKLAERIGLSGLADKDTFFALCENINPLSGEQLTPRTNDNRTVGYDINFHAPKSVSIVHAFSDDNHIQDAFTASVQDTMRIIEEDCQTRVRLAGQYFDRKAGELLWIDFVHQTSRPVGNQHPDMHLHSHCYVFNMTYDPYEKRIKAGQFRDIKRDAPYYQALFHKRLSDRLMDLGYQVRRTESAFEIVGVPDKVIELFSKRTGQIERVAKQKGITNRKQLDALGAATRNKKEKGISLIELKANWKKQVRDSGHIKAEDAQQVIRHKVTPKVKDLTPAICVDNALQHVFERASVMPKRRILEAALRNSIGDNTVTQQAVHQRLDNDPRLHTVQEGMQEMCTTVEVLREEKAMIEMAREGIGKLKALYAKDALIPLDGEQQAALRHVLTTSDRISIVRGAAGVGKTYIMQEAKKMFNDAGKYMIVVAPTVTASRGVLRDDGFNNAETVAKLLDSKEMQSKLQNQVLWVDEAGLLGTKEMADIIQLANKANAQLIFGGDTKQHASVIRGDALRILNKVGGIRCAEVTEIRRQKDARYKDAIEDLSKGAIGSGFQKLDRMGAIMEVEPDAMNERLIADYLAALKRGKSALIISPTHAQGNKLTQEVRQQLRANRKLGKKEIDVTRYTTLPQTVAEKQDVRNYHPGHVIHFNQNFNGIKRGSKWTVVKVEEDQVRLQDKDGKTTYLPYGKASGFDVLVKDKMPVSNGDIVRITRGLYIVANKQPVKPGKKAKPRKRLDNGDVLKVRAIDPDGTIRLQNPKSKVFYTVDKDFGHMTHAHCITSYASQGKTVDEVFVCQPESTFKASNAKQFYVSASRGKERAHFYTDDKKGLLEHVTKLGDRQSAHELLGYSKHLEHQKNMERHKAVISPEQSRSAAKEFQLNQALTQHKDYEPGL
jgi:conjugative relaxase-like TrwC/TraI family protein